MLDDKEVPVFPVPFSESSTLVGDRALLESKPTNFHYLLQCKVLLKKVSQYNAMQAFMTFHMWYRFAKSPI
jgi:hypothetical protein